MTLIGVNGFFHKVQFQVQDRSPTPSVAVSTLRFRSNKSAFESALFCTFWRKNTFFGTFISTLKSDRTFFSTFFSSIFCTFS